MDELTARRRQRLDEQFQDYQDCLDRAEAELETRPWYQGLSVEEKCRVAVMHAVQLYHNGK